MLTAGKNVEEISAATGRTLFAIRQRCYVLKVAKRFPQIRDLIRVIDKRPMTVRLALRQRLTASRARDGKGPCDLTIDYLLQLWERQGGKCFYTGRQLSPEPNHPNTLSLDRQDSSVGYVQGNVVICIWDVNAMKQDLSHERFVELCHDVARVHPQSIGLSAA